MNKLMTAIYSAMAEGNDIIIDQISDDIRTARFSEVDGVEYKIYSDPEDPEAVIIEDKVNNEKTKAKESEDGEIKLEDKSYSVNKNWYVIDKKIGIVASGNKGSLGALLGKNPKLKMVKKSDLTESDLFPVAKKFSLSGQKEFSRSNNSYVVTDSTGKVVATMDKANASHYLSKNNGSKMVLKREWNEKKNKEYKI